MTEAPGSEYCADQVRSYDYARYFAALFAPPETRRDMMALYAFNLELASTRERVSEALIGEMRLQWWRDTVEGIYAGTVRKHAVAEELARTIDRSGLDRAALDALIDARAFDLAEEPPEDRASLLRYVAETAGGLAALAARICGGDSETARSAGTVWGLVGILRAVPYHASLGQVRLPRDAMRKAALRADDVAAGTKRSEIGEAVAPLAAEARDMLQRCRADAGRLDRVLRPAIAYTGIAETYLDRLGRRGGDVFDARTEPGRLAQQWRTARTALTGKL